MSAVIKNCGLKTPHTIDQAIATGASFVGFVHHVASPRHLSAAEIEKLIAHTKGRVKTVVVLVNPTDAVLNSLPKPDYWQLHNVSDPGRIAEITVRTGIPVISAVSVRTAEDISLAYTLEAISSHILFDAKSPGSGQAFDWQLLKGQTLVKPWFLAGGLTPENVAEAVRITRAPMVDVSSGIESTLGEKSLEKIAAFNAAVIQPAHG